MSEPAGPFAVWQFFVGAQCLKQYEGDSAWKAVATANICTQTLGAQIGSTCRVVVMDASGNTVWEWRYGEGLVKRTPEVKSDG